MFKLERVEISGFKSFYEKVDLAFPGEVTAVVGPNGCGKSNICDAVAWALGEQSARVLRGERMDDVIFNGSAKRRPLGMAEVILTLTVRAKGNGNGNGNGNGDGHGESEPEVLRIGRRVYREGQGEYFLNDKQVRLKDIQDRLLGTGLGVRAYSVIEQGRIDQVLSTKPQDRRRLIEEAAGITRYKLKKRFAETKLEETRGNLLRISDIIAEIERNCASLKRQASRASRYKEKTAELKEKKGFLARVRHDRHQKAVDEAARLKADRQDREAQAAVALARAEAELASARLAASEALAERDGLRDRVASLEAAIQRDQALREGNRRAALDLASREELLERESVDFSAQRVSAAREQAELEERIERAVLEARNRSLAREESDWKATAAAAALASLEREVENARGETLSAAGERIEASNARHEAELELSRVGASLARLEESLGKTARGLEEREAEVLSAAEEESRLSADSGAVAEALARAEAEVARLSEAIAHAESQRESARESLGAIEHRVNALSEIARSREGTVQEARAALAAAGFPEEGPLSARLRPSPGWEGAVDLLLGSDLEALVSSGDPLAGIEASRQLPSLGLVRSGWSERTPRSAADASFPGWEIALENFSRLSPAERAALPPAAFVETFADALKFSVRFPTMPFVTRGRELVRGSLVRAVHSPAEVSGPFALARQIADLEAEGSLAKQVFSAAEATLAELRQERGRREAALPLLRGRERESESRVSGLRALLRERGSERDRLVSERETLSREIEMLRDVRKAVEGRRSSSEETERDRAARETESRGRLEALVATLPEARSFAAAAAEDLAHRRTEAEVAAERRRSAEAAREKHLESVRALDRRASEASEEANRLADRKEELSREETEAAARLEGNLSALGLCSADLARVSEGAAEASTRVERAEQGSRAERGALDVAREGRFEAEMAESRVRSDLEHQAAQAQEEFGVPPAELPLPSDASEEALALLETEAAELAAAIDRIGPVNILAYEEYNEESKRLEFLTAQRDDLLRSIQELTDSIRKINVTSSERFRAAFDAINENFKAMFARLFQGGAAEMRLLDETDVLESGVEIVAQPPGKRNQSILLLSGGEKALAAIALLMAIFRYKPSPFCILDEVDAPLDEANIDRFTRLLREMTQETQFIAITHNKRTMETADAMYGVTMQEPGCSKIVSVKFD